MSDIHVFLRDTYDYSAVKCDFLCTVNDWNLTPDIRSIVSQIHPETMKRYYGCGLNTPEGVEGKRILDIGCGSGSLVFVLSKLVGPIGSVVGVDMSPKLFDEAINRTFVGLVVIRDCYDDVTVNIAECVNREDYHRDQWGYDKKNTEFFLGNAEDISQLQDQSFDVIVHAMSGMFVSAASSTLQPVPLPVNHDSGAILPSLMRTHPMTAIIPGRSNGVFSLVPDKSKAFSEAFRLIKDGGEFYLNDIYAETPAPAELKDDLRFWDWAVTGSQLPGELLSSAMNVGFTQPHLTSVGPLDMIDSFKKVLPGRRYLCASNRMFRLGSGSDRGPASVTYKGNIKGHKSEFKWDVNMTFQTGEAVPVDGELASILANTRYKEFFDFEDSSAHVETRRRQDPFVYLDHLSSQGKHLPCIFTMGQYL